METLLAIVAGVAGVAAAVAFAGLRRARAGARAQREASERERTELEARRELAATERRAADLALSAMEDGVLLFGPDGRAIVSNGAAERHLGGRPASVDALLPLPMRSLVRRAAEGGAAETVEVETGPERRTLRGFAAPAGGSVVLVIRDVTEPRRLDRVRRDFVANASHELKTPAASIQAAAETIATAAVEDPSVIPRFAEQLQREAIRLTRIVSDLLDLSRLETGGELGEPVALDAIVRDEGERFVDPAAEAGVALELATARVPRVHGSARDLALLVRNLVDNAIRYTPRGGRVEVAVASEDREVVLTVRDTGLGIPGRDLPRVFERFYRVDRARSRETGGTGLGLAIAKHVVENHGGRIEVTSELGRGTRFEVRLPAEA